MKFARILAAAVITVLAGATPYATPPQPPATTPPVTVHRFAAQLRAGFAPMVEAPDGTLFGVMESGGVGDYGAVFTLAPDGSGGFAFSILYQFDNEDGAAPRGLTYYAPDDILYGVTARGGINPGSGLVDGLGTIFTLSRSGVLTPLHDLNLSGVPQPLGPQAPLLLASDGNFYGVAGGASSGFSLGSLFKLTPAGQLDLLHSFTGADGSNPAAQLVEGTDGYLYGTTTTGGANDDGTVFRIDKDGNDFSTLHTFASGLPANTQPRGLMLDTSTGSDLFYGLTGGGGTGGRGAIFDISPAGAYHLRASFPVSFGFALKGSSPNGALVKGSDGLFYGTTEGEGPIPFGSIGTVFSFDPALNAIEVVHDYNSDVATGVATRAGLLAAANGTLLGTTTRGGAHRVGTVYRVDLTTSPQTVSKVADVPSLGPWEPEHRLLRASDGLLYGTTVAGGAFNSGAIVRVNTAGRVTTLHDFNFLDGHQPSGELTEGSDGYLYGTTTYGGNVQFQGDFGGGTVYRIARSGADFSIVHRFTDYAVEGAQPLAGVVEGPDGNFYGTTHQNGPGGAGTVFRMTPSGDITTLHSFSVWSATTGTLVLGPDGYFYGVTREGGTNPNGGTIYKINGNGHFVLLHEFVDPADGAHPNGLALGTDGNLYGTTEHGGTFFGTLFRITPAGTFTVLHRFDRDVDGSDPMAAPFEAGDGRLYGTAWLGGRVAPFISGSGTLYRYDGTGFHLLYTFGTSPNDTGGPIAGVTQGDDNLLYGLHVYPTGGAVYEWDGAISNQAPVVRHARLSVGAGAAGVVTLPGSDPDGDPLTFTLVGQPANGSVLGSGGGPSFQYLPNPGFSGTDFFYVRASDGIVSSAVAGVMVTVGASNTAPVAYDGSVTTAEDSPVTASLITFDADGNPLSFTVVTPPAHGTLSGAAPDLFYNPASNYNGPDSFTFKVNDGSADSNVATFSITVDPVNDPPVAVDQSLTTSDAPVPVVLSATDVEGDPLTYQIVDAPLNGVLSGLAPNLTYTPNAGFTGTDTFTFYPHDGTAAGTVGTITIDVTPPNRPPVANPGGPYTGDLGEAISVDGSLSSDPDGDPIVFYRWFVNSTQVASGAVTSIVATNLGIGVHTLTLQVTDGAGLMHAASTTITVRALFVSFTAVPNPAACQQAVTFDGTGSDNRPGRTIVSYRWTFSDGTTDSGATVSHTFGRFGSYTASLTLTDDLAMVASTSTIVNVSLGNQPPVAIPGGPYVAYSNATSIGLNGAASTDPNTSCGDGIVSYEWRVNGTISLSGSAPSLTAVQVASLGQGTFPVVLTVTDVFGAQSSASTSLTIQPIAVGTTTVLQGPPATIGALQPVTLTAIVTPSVGSGVPTGSVEFLIGGSTVVGVAQLQGGVAVLTTSGSLTAGVYAVTARYGGDALFTGSTSAPVDITVRPVVESTYTILIPWAAARPLGSLVVVSAAVGPIAGTSAVTGTVEFFEGTLLVGSAPVIGGLATVAWTPAAAGTLTISARYPGSATVSGSVSQPVQITVFSGATPASTTTTLAVTPPQGTFGQAVTFTATVSNPPAGGTVTFYSDGVVLGTAPVVNVGGSLRATLTTAAMPLGVHVVSASYGGTAGFAASNTAPIALFINP